MSKFNDQKLLELEQRVLLLEKHKKELESQVETADKKAIFFDMIFDNAKEEFKISIGKDTFPGQSIDSKSSKKMAK